MALNHVILKEFYADRQVPFFEDYVRKFTDLPFLVKLSEKDGTWRQGEFLRADEFERSSGIENAEWSLCVADRDGEVRVPHGSWARAGASRKATGTWT
jgi:nitrate reductase / nitrite oxidoreductase, alpha subunit